jgi:hypothetical protein
MYKYEVITHFACHLNDSLVSAYYDWQNPTELDFFFFVIGINSSSSSSVGCATLVGFGLLKCRWAFSAGRFYRMPLLAARQTPNLEENQGFRAFQLSPQEAPSV